MKTLNWTILLALCVIISFTIIACGDDDDDDSSGDDDDDSSGDDDDDSDFTCDGDVCTDSISGLMWQNEDEPVTDWDAAISYCENLELGGYSDWRLPTISELRSLVRDCPETETGGSCGVTDDCLDHEDCYDHDLCNSCEWNSGPGPDGQNWPAGLLGGGWYHWSSSEYSGDYYNAYEAWAITEAAGVGFDFDDGGNDGDARCVRN